MPLLHVLAGLAFAGWALRLSVIDFREHRLPDRLLLPAYPGIVLLNLVVFPAQQTTGLLGGGVALVAAAVLHRVAGLGLGDVKLIGVCVLAVTPTGTLATALVCIALVGGAHAIIHTSITRNLRDDIPFGPAILTGTALALLASI